MSSYKLDNTSGILQIIVHPGRSDGPGIECLKTSTDLTFFGMGSLRWGEGVDQNLLRLLENFACPQKESNDKQPPGTPDKVWPKGPEDAEIPNEFLKDKKTPGIKAPTTGQIWFNTSDKTSYVFDATGDNSNGEWLPMGANKDYLCGTTAVCGTLDFNSPKCSSLSKSNSDCLDRGIIKGAKLEDCSIDHLCGKITISGELNFSPTNKPSGHDCLDQGIIKGAKIINSEVEGYIPLCGTDIPVCAELDFSPHQCYPHGTDCVKPGIIKGAKLIDCEIISTAPKPPEITKNDFTAIKEILSQIDASAFLKNERTKGTYKGTDHEIANLDSKGVYKITIEGGPSTGNYELDFSATTKIPGAHYGNHVYLPPDPFVMGKFSVIRDMTKEEVAAEVFKLIKTGRRSSSFKLAVYDGTSDFMHVLMADFTASNATVKQTLIDVSLDFASDDIDTGPDVSILPDFDKELERIQSMIPELPDDLTRKNEVYKYIFIKGTRLVFAQGSAPAGWRLDTSNDNRMLRMVSRGGGGVGGKNDPYVMRGGEVPSHSHVAKTDNQGAHGHSNSMTNAGNHGHHGQTTTNGNHKHKVWTGGNGNHSHTYKYCQNVSLSKPGGVGVGFQGIQSHPTRNTSSQGNHTHAADMGNDGNHLHGLQINTSGGHRHTITINNSISHNHTVSVYNNTTSGSSWQPRYINVITCIKD